MAASTEAAAVQITVLHAVQHCPLCRQLTKNGLNTVCTCLLQLFCINRKWHWCVLPRILLGTWTCQNGLALGDRL